MHHMFMKENFGRFAILFKDAAEKGTLLLVACFLALILSNSPFFESYHNSINQTLIIGNAHITLLHFINDFLMVFFFLLVGMEIKREMISGHLATAKQRILPIVGAIGGVVGPIIFYLSMNYQHQENHSGWAIPSATDIAFAIAVFAMLGKGLSPSLRVFLTALAIIDDLIAIVIIALFYSSDFNLQALLFAFLLMGILYALNKKRVVALRAYIGVGVLLWIAVVYSGIHATIAGVILGFAIPLKGRGNSGSPLEYVEKKIHPFVLFIILPLFAFANSGVRIVDISLSEILNPISIGIALGLFFGKQLGIMSVCYIGSKFKLLNIPNNSTWLQFYGVAILCGVGFTMSLFIGSLSFSESIKLDYMKIGVLFGSLISVIYGGIILQIAKRRT